MTTAHNLTDDGLPQGLTVNEFLVWSKDQPGRYELHNGNVVAMSPERLGHVEIKSNVHQALRNAIKSAGLPYFAVADGIAVHVSETKWYQPDALVYCGERADRSVTKIDNPMIVVEVASPSTAGIDTQDKLLGYLALPSPPLSDYRARWAAAASPSSPIGRHLSDPHRRRWQLAPRSARHRNRRYRTLQLKRRKWPL